MLNQNLRLKQLYNTYLEQISNPDITKIKDITSKYFSKMEITEMQHSHYEITKFEAFMYINAFEQLVAYKAQEDKLKRKPQSKVVQSESESENISLFEDQHIIKN